VPLLVYYIWLAEEQQEVIEQLTISREELETEIRQLDDRMGRLDGELAQANANLAEKEARVQQLLKDIAYLQTQVQVYIRQGQMAEADRDRYQGMYEQLNFYNTKYRKEIAQLREENERLRQQLASSQTANDSLREQTDQIRTELNQAQITLESSRALSASNWRLIAVKRTREVEGNTLKARDLTDELKICLTVGPNPAAERGNRTVYITVNGPNSRTRLVEGSQTAGTFEYNGQIVLASAQTALNYTGQESAVCARLRVPEGFRFEEGAYVVAAYADGFRLGETRLVVE
jgi:myosin heavy subunit